MNVRAVLSDQDASGLRVSASRGYISLTLSVDEALRCGIVTELQQLAKVPGVSSMEEGGNLLLTVPCSVWGMSLWRTICERLEIESEPRLKERVPVRVRRPLYKHQLEAVSFLTRGFGGYLGDSPGLGKTASAAVSAEILRRTYARNKQVLIVGPSYVAGSWCRELLALGLIDSPSEFCVLQGMKNKSGWNPQAPFAFISYHLLHSWAVRLRYARAHAVVVFDEAHNLKNKSSNRAQAALDIGSVAVARIMLSGTPIPNKLSEFWMPLTILDGPKSWGSIYDFAARYCGGFNTGFGFKLDSPLSSRHDELKERLATRYLRRTPYDAGVTLPPLKRVRIDAAIDSDEKASLYERHKALIRLIASAGARVSDVFHFTPVNYGGIDSLTLIHEMRLQTSMIKLDATLATACDVMEQGEPVVVFFWMRKHAERAASKLSQAGFVAQYVHGGLSADDRDAIVRRFQGGEIQAICSTIDALREGVTLDRARFVIMHDLDWTPASMLQGEARIYRVSQKRACISVWMFCQNSFDEIMVAYFLTKAKQNQIIGIDEYAQLVYDLGLEKVTQKVVEDARIDEFDI